MERVDILQELIHSLVALEKLLRFFFLCDLTGFPGCTQGEVLRGNVFEARSATTQGRRFTHFHWVSSPWHISSLLLFLEFFHSTCAHDEIARHHLLDVRRDTRNKGYLITSFESLVNQFLPVLVILIKSIITLKIFIAIFLRLTSVFMLVWFIAFTSSLISLVSKKIHWKIIIFFARISEF